MTARIVGLTSHEASDARVAGTVDERLALVGVLSQSAWRATGRPLPSYPRHEMPVNVTSLGARVDRD